LNLPSINGTLATEEYVDALAQSLDPKASVRVATQAALPAVTYNNGAAGVGATLTADAVGALPVIDDITLVAGDRILVKNQADATQNGIYVVTVAGDAGTAFVLTRGTDCDGSPANEVSGGMFTFVEQGTVSGGHGYVLIFDGNAVIGTDVLNFTQFSGAGQLIGGDGISIDGNTVNIDASYWDDIQQINTWNVAGVTGMVQADLQKLADMDVTAAELNELNGAGCTNADFVKLHNITVSAVQLSDVATLTRLASTTNGDGASLIGVEAIAGLTATTVQAALAELLGNDNNNSANLTALDAAVNGRIDSIDVALGIPGDVYVTGTGSLLNVATSFMDADEILEAKAVSLQGELDATQAGAGLNPDGAYTPNATANYISTAQSLKDADNKLDLAIESEEVARIAAVADEAAARTAADDALSGRLDAVEGGALGIVDYDFLGNGDGSQVLYTVSAAAYLAGTLKVYINGLLMKKGTAAGEVQETDPATGTFTFGTAPAIDDEIIVAHR
jgi:hypothetical protein